MTSDNAIPRLTDGAPRTETVAYRFPPVRPCAPPADECSDEDLFTIVADALRNGHDLYALLGSRDHVRAILDLVQRLDLAHRDALEELAAERRVRGELIDQHAQLSRENVKLRHQLAGTTPVAVQIAFDRAARAVTGQSAADLTAHLNDQLRRYPDQAFDDSDVATEVVALEDTAGGER